MSKQPRRPEVGNVRRYGRHVQLYPDTHQRLKRLAARWSLTLAEAADRALLWVEAAQADDAAGDPVNTGEDDGSKAR